MPRSDVDRDAYFRQLKRRLRWSWRFSKLQRRFSGDMGSLQAAAYDRTFRSDEEAVSYFYAGRNDHLPDFANPTWVNEKIRWQYLNHPNPLFQIAADKVGVRDYLRYKNAQILAPELYGVGSTVEEFLAADLPERYVLKSGSGWAQNCFVDGGAPGSQRGLAATLAEWELWDHWRFLGELHYRGIPKRWLAEEIVEPVGRINEYKFYCLMGEPQFFLYVTDRTDSGIRSALFDPQWRPTPFHLTGHPAIAERPERVPAAFEKMLAEARLLSEDFMHVRVDFLECEGRVYFSELTFSGGGARNPFLPRIQNEVFGEMMDIRRAEDYCKRGRAISSTLTLPMPAAA